MKKIKFTGGFCFTVSSFVSDLLFSLALAFKGN